MVSLLYTDRKEDLSDVNVPFPDIFDQTDIKTDDKGYQAEGQYLYRSVNFNTTVGGGTYYVDTHQTSNETVTASGMVFPFPETEDNFDRKQTNVYVYNNINIPNNVTWTLGSGFDTYKDESIDFNRVSPKFGVQWGVTDRIRLRAAALQTVKRALVVQQTLEPTQVAGFNQFFDDFNGTTADLYGVGMDLRVSQDLYSGVEASYRNMNLKTKVFEGGKATETVNTNQDEQVYRLYADWTLANNWALNSEVRFAQFDSEDTLDPDIPKHVKTSDGTPDAPVFQSDGLVRGGRADVRLSGGRPT